MPLTAPGFRLWNWLGEDPVPSEIPRSLQHRKPFLLYSPLHRLGVKDGGALFHGEFHGEGTVAVAGAATEPALHTCSPFRLPVN